MFGNPRHRTMRLEDGEMVVQIRGGGRRRNVSYPSNLPHAGLWSETEGYAILYFGARAGRRPGSILAFDPSLDVKTTDAEILVRGPRERIRNLLDNGPPFCRARLRQTARDPSALTGFRFPSRAAHG